MCEVGNRRRNGLYRKGSKQKVSDKVRAIVDDGTIRITIFTVHLPLLMRERAPFGRARGTSSSEELMFVR